MTFSAQRWIVDADTQLPPAGSARRWSCRNTAGTITAIRPGGNLRRREPIFCLWVGPPTTNAARRIDLPPFVVTLLQEAMDSHDHEQLFVTVEGHWYRRPRFARPIWWPACDGDHDRSWAPIAPGAVFHGLRHHHRTTLDELHVVES